MFARRMFSGVRVVGMRDARPRDTLIRRNGAVTRKCGAARGRRRGMTAQAATPAVAAPTTATGVAATATTAAAAARVSATAR
jgi:hypothetical protein